VKIVFEDLKAFLEVEGKRLLVKRGLDTTYYEAFLWRNGLVRGKEEAFRMANYLKNIAEKELEESSAKNVEPLTFVSEGVNVEVVKDSGIHVPPHGFVLSNAEELIAGETTYCWANIVMEKETKKGKKIVEVSKQIPVMFLSFWRNGSIVERRYKMFTFDREPISFDGRKVTIITKNISENGLDTMMTEKTYNKFLGGEKSLSFPEIHRLITYKMRKWINFSFDKRLYDVVACYIMGTYFYDLFDCYPRLHFYGAWGSGKTRSMKFVTYASRHGFIVINPSQASSFRTIEAIAPTLGIDEKLVTPDLEVLLAAGYKKGLKVPRVEKSSKERFVVEFFNVYAPVVISSKDDIGENLRQKTIVVNMRILSDPHPEHRDPEPADLENVREELYLARLTRTWEVFDVKRKMKIEKMEGRSLEIWFPLLVMAKLAGEDVFRNVLDYALEDDELRRQDFYWEEKCVLRALERMFQRTENGELVFSSKEVQEEIRDILVEEEKELDEYEFRRYWTVRRVGRIIKRSLKIKQKFRNRRRVYMVSAKEFRKLCSEFGYGGAESNGSNTNNTSATLPLDSPSKLFREKLISSLPPAKKESRAPKKEAKEKKTSSVPEKSVASVASVVPKERGKRVSSEAGSLLTCSFKLEDVVLKALSTSKAKELGLSEIEIYRILVRMQRYGKIRRSVRYVDVLDVLEKLEDEGRIVEKNGLFFLK